MDISDATGTEAQSRHDERDWRLEAELNVPDARRTLRDLVGRIHGSNVVVKEVEAGMPHDVMITHDGRLLFAYAASSKSLETARRTIEDVLGQDEIDANVRISYWNDELDCWRQTDPPPTAQQKRLNDIADRDAETVETRTLVASSGKLIRREFEQTMLKCAGRLNVECEIVEHPHLLTTQVAFTVTGPKRKLDEFAEGLNAEELATIRADTGVILSPL